jgi:hypothetical protein
MQNFKGIKMIKSDIHKQMLEKLDSLIDPVHILEMEKLHFDLSNGKRMPYLPCIMGISKDFDEWPQYPFSQTWDDIEKNLINSLRMVYWGALIKDDRLYQIRPEYGVVNIPEVFGVKSVITDQGNSMSKGFNDLQRVRDIIEKGIPKFNDKHTAKIKEYYDFAKNVLSQYENLCKFIHFTLPDTQGPFDLACLIWGYNIMYDFYDNIELVEQLLELLTETFIQYNQYLKSLISEPLNEAYHICGLKLVNGGIRICDDSATLISPQQYRKYVVPRNIKAFSPFGGGWLHFCGNGNHIIDDMIAMDSVCYLHLGNPDYHDCLSLIQKTSEKQIVLYWSGSLDFIKKAIEICDYCRLLVLIENRYAPKDLDDAKYRLQRVRNAESIEKSLW